MKVTRDVMLDLLPMYFAGDVSADTRALVDEFLASDPEFGRMAERFRLLMSERLQPGLPDSEAEREKAAFAKVRARVGLRQAAMVWALGAAFAIAVAALTGANGRFGFGHPGVIIGIVFGVMAVSTLLLSWTSRPEHWYAAFSGTE